MVAQLSWPFAILLEIGLELAIYLHITLKIRPRVSFNIFVYYVLVYIMQNLIKLTRHYVSLTFLTLSPRSKSNFKVTQQQSVDDFNEAIIEHLIIAKLKLMH